MVKILTIIGIAQALLVSCQPFQSHKKPPKMISDAVSSYVLQKEETLKSLSFLTDAPHPMNSQRQIEVRDHLVSRLRAMNLEASIQAFSTPTPNKNAHLMLAPPTLVKQGFNVHTRLNMIDNPNCVVAFASHYDTKDIEGFEYVGANDSGSSSVLLLDLAHFLIKNKANLKLKCDIELIWFDGEESVLHGWDDGIHKHPARMVDNTYGSRRFAQDLTQCSCDPKASCLREQNKDIRFLALVLLDMVGYADLKLTLDEHSHSHLKGLLIAATGFLDRKTLLNARSSQAVSDDHLPFKEKGVAVLDIIDFNHIDLWHTPLDRLETVSMESLELSGKLALYVLLSVALNPDSIRKNAGTPCQKTG